MDGAAITTDDLRNAPDLDALEERLAARDLTPGWIDREKPILAREPDTDFVPAHWRWSDAKAGMDAAAGLIGTDKAERRNLVMRNPIPDNGYATSRTLVSAYQTILPGEYARSHRHSPHALRVILDSHGAWSIVNGEKHPMETGDIVLTPGMCWHGHGHDGQDQAYWFDGLDVPLVGLTEAMFYEDHPAGMEPAERVTPDSPFRFTWERTMREIDQAQDDPDGFFGRRIAYDTSDTMPTIGIHVQHFEAGFQSRPYRSSANTIWCVMQGAGTSTVDGQAIDWSFGDTFIVPTWKGVQHAANDDSVLFSMTDEPVMRFCKYWHFEALD